ncbi:MAG TPA: TolC family protein [Candidatus Aminicenantes bacterium]|nr:TolC family protein [Candidatus Aminicenantes bacterium]HRY63981.1 TolC family protein [Candidatus Aminicenantes bacterium]HRZ70894.1 TolC family protein [Candidatus Aminicenantes bacterium]
MRKPAVALFALAFALLGPGVLAAQEPRSAVVLTLEEAVAMALRQNPFHMASQEKVDQARAGVRQAASGFLPTLAAQGTNTLDEKLFVLEFPSMTGGTQRISVDFTKDYQMALAFSMPLFAGGRLTAGYKQAQYGLKASREAVRLSEQETVFEVKRAFYGYLLAREFSAVADEALALAEKFRENVKNLHAVGMASKFDLLRSEVQVANLKPQAIRARNSVEVAALGLKTVVGLGLDAAIEVRGELAAPPLEPGSQGVIEEAMAQRPELRQLDYQQLMARQSLRIARGSLLPTLAVGGTYSIWGDAMNFRRGTWQNYYTINLSLSLNIFDGFLSRAQAGQAKAAIREIQWTRKGLSEAIAFEVRQAVLNNTQARETLVSQEKNVEQAREAVRIAELNYSEGLATNLDVMTAQVALSQARTNHSQALYDCVISQAQLEKAVGRSRSESRSN